MYRWKPMWLHHTSGHKVVAQQTTLYVRNMWRLLEMFCKQSACLIPLALNLPCLHSGLVVLVRMQSAYHITHPLCVVMWHWHRSEHHIMPIVMSVMYHVAIAAETGAQTAAEPMIVLATHAATTDAAIHLQQCRGGWGARVRINGVVDLASLGQPSVGQLVFVDVCVRIHSPRNVVSAKKGMRRKTRC